MGRRIRLLAAFAGLLALPLPAKRTREFHTKLSNDEQIRHVLARLTFGERPGDFAAVKKLGLKKWVNQQLQPEKMAENPVLEARLNPLDSLSMTTERLATYHPRAGAARPREPVRGRLVAAATTEERRKILMDAAPIAAVQFDLIEAKMLRAVYSNRQLNEVLADFWFNHFNVFLNKGPDRFLTTAYERDAIRPHVFGKFRELLKATAQSPAMLFYLDNWQSVSPDTVGRARKNGRFRGLNENYAREILELHTMGVDGGYTQQDIVDVARCFTGWTIIQPYRVAKFEFNERVHDKGEKTVLGVKIAAGGGIDDGLKVLEILARHPSTAKHISYRLAQRFVADQPPPELVARMAETFRKTDGDIRAVMKTMLESPEFWSTGAYQAKVKSPLEMVASAVRATNADVSAAFALADQIARLGQPLYRKQEPTGYPNNGEEWLNSAGLLGRLNFATALTSNRIPGVKVDVTALNEGADVLAKRLGSPEFQKR